MNLSAVMDELASSLGVIDGLRAFAFEPGSISPPSAWVDLPESIDYDATMGRGGDRITLTVRVVVGSIDSRSSRDLLSAYADGSGARSIKETIEAYTPTSFGSARVTSVEFGVIPVAGIEYLAAMFNIDIIGQGA